MASWHVIETKPVVVSVEGGEQPPAPTIGGIDPLVLLGGLALAVSMMSRRG